MRHSTRTPKDAFAFDLHVLSTPPAFVLSQDQTLQFESCKNASALLMPKHTCFLLYGYKTVDEFVPDLLPKSDFADSLVKDPTCMTIQHIRISKYTACSMREPQYIPPYYYTVKG